MPTRNFRGYYFSKQHLKYHRKKYNITVSDDEISPGRGVPVRIPYGHPQCTFTCKYDAIWFTATWGVPVTVSYGHPPAGEFRKTECANRKFSLRSFVFRWSHFLRTPKNGLNGQVFSLRRAFSPDCSSHLSLPTFTERLGTLLNNLPKTNQTRPPRQPWHILVQNRTNTKFSGILFFQMDILIPPKKNKYLFFGVHFFTFDRGGL